MNKRKLVLPLLFILVLVGCQKPIFNEYYFYVDQVQFESETTITFTINIEWNYTSFKENEIVRVGLVIHKQNDEVPLTDYGMSVEGIQEETVFTLPENTTIHTEWEIQPYIVYTTPDETKTIYSSTILRTTFLELAHKQEDNEYAKKIILRSEEKIIDSIFVAMNTKTYTASSLSESYTTSITTDYNKITLTILLNEGFFFDERISLYINEKLIDSALYQIQLDNIVYQIDDPNWTKPY